MDMVAGEARYLKRELGQGDRDKLDAWFTSIREAERRLKANEAWVNRPKPRPDAEPPTDIDTDNAAAIEGAFLDVLFLALQTDSTRFATLHVPDGRVTAIEGVDRGYHNLSHHGRDDEKIGQLALVEQAVINEWANFLRKLKSARDGDKSLLDDTQVLLTSNLGNASSHDNRNLPVLFAGGGYRHGQHLAFDQKNNYPLPNLYLGALQRAGLPLETFATSSETMAGLELG